MSFLLILLRKHKMLYFSFTAKRLDKMDSLSRPQLTPPTIFMLLGTSWGLQVQRSCSSIGALTVIYLELKVTWTSDRLWAIGFFWEPQLLCQLLPNTPLITLQQRQTAQSLKDNTCCPLSLLHNLHLLNLQKARWKDICALRSRSLWPHRHFLMNKNLQPCPACHSSRPRMLVPLGRLFKLSTLWTAYVTEREEETRTLL